MNTTDRATRYSVASMRLGVLSIFLWGFSIIPLAAIITGILSIHYSEESTLSRDALIGVGLGTLFLIVRIAHL